MLLKVHLEADPSQYESDEDKRKALKESNPARVEIFSDLLSTHLGLDCSKEKGNTKYSVGYFLGSHEVHTFNIIRIGLSLKS